MEMDVDPKVVAKFGDTFPVVFDGSARMDGITCEAVAAVACELHDPALGYIRWRLEP